jgi:hypothetical protein
VFLITAATVRSWMKRVDEEGRDALVQLGEPVNRAVYHDILDFSARVVDNIGSQIW